MRPDPPSKLSSPMLGTAPQSPAANDHGAAPSAPSRVFDLRSHELLDRIGRGGMGEVYRGRDPALDRDLAIKVLRPELCGSHAAESRFEQEASITGALQHPNIVPIHNLGRLPDGRLYFTMKLVSGHTLAEMLADRTGADRVPELVSIFEKVCQAVAFAHHRNVIHRDLKPANVMVGAFGEVQVMDWGLAKVLPRTETAERADMPTVLYHPGESSQPAGGDATVAGTILGTPSYMAPEQARGEIDRLDTRTDVFGLGAVLCEILTGKPPFVARNMNECLRLAMAGDLTEAWARLDACGADSELVELARCCLAPAPKDRPADAGVVAKVVQDYQAELRARLERAEVERAAALARSQEEQKRRLVERQKRRVLMLLAGLVVLIVCAGSGLALWYQHEKTQRDAALQIQEREEHQRREQAEKEIAQALQDARETRQKLADHLRQPGGVFALLDRPAEWQGPLQTARGLVKQAQARAQGLKEPLAGPLEANLNRLLEQLEADDLNMQLARRLEQIREERRIQLSNERMKPGARIAGSENTHAFREYEEVFRQLGLKLATDQDAHDAALIQLSPIREELLAALDDCAVAAATPQDAPLVQRFLRLARLADADPIRNAFRDADQGRKGRALKELAERLLTVEAVKGSLSRSQVPMAAEYLLRQDERNEAWVRRACLLYPGEFWLSALMGQYLYSKGKYVEAAGYYRAATAVRPNSLMAWFNLGEALYHLEDFQGASDAFSNALAIEPRLAVCWNNLGNILLRLNNPQGALAAFRKATEIEPKMGMAWRNLGSRLSAQKDQAAAIAAFRQATVVEPNYLFGWVRLADHLHGHQDFMEAVAAYDRALKLAPRDAVLWIKRGRALAALKDYPGAVAACEKALALDLDNREAWGLLLDVRKEQGDRAGIENAYRKIITLQPTDYSSWFLHALAHSSLGDPLGAADAYRKATAITPDAAMTWNNLGASVKDSDPREALAAFRKAIALDPRLGMAWRNLGSLLTAQKAPADALAAFRQAAVVDAKNPLSWLRLGDCLQDQKDFKGAAEAYDHALTLSPKDPALWIKRGRALARLKDYPAAAAAFRKALALNPDDGEAWLDLGDVSNSSAACRRGADAFHKVLTARIEDDAAWKGLGRALRGPEAGRAAHPFNPLPRLHSFLAQTCLTLGRFLDEGKLYGPAASLYARAAGFSPQDAGTWLALGIVHRTVNNHREAASAYRNSLALDPRQALAWMHLGDALTNQNDRKGGLSAYREALAVNPQDVHGWIHLGAALRAQKDFPGAAEALRKALALEPRSALAWLRLGQTLHALRDAEAAPACKKALEIDARLPEAWLVVAEDSFQRGRFAEAAAGCRKALHLLAPPDPVHTEAREQLQKCEQMVEREKRLKAVLDGTAAAPAETIAFAEHCCRFGRRDAEAARLYAAAFAAQPRLADDLTEGHRFRAAGAALRGAARLRGSRSEEANSARLRLQALAWLRADLNLLRARAFLDGKVRQPGAASATELLWVVDQLRRWQHHPDCKSVREEKDRAELPASEQKEWQELWPNVRDLTEKIQACLPSAMQHEGKLTSQHGTRAHPVQLVRDTTYVFILESRSFSPVLRLEDTLGNTLMASKEDAMGGREARLVYTALKDGTCWLLASSADGKGMGGYRIEMRTLRSPR